METETEDGIPRYTLTERAYLRANDDDFERLHEEGTQISFAGVPGAHMKPVNAAAHAQVKKFKPIKPDMNKLTPL